MPNTSQKPRTVTKADIQRIFKDELAALPKGRLEEQFNPQSVQFIIQDLGFDEGAAQLVLALSESDAQSTMDDYYAGMDIGSVDRITDEAWERLGITPRPGKRANNLVTWNRTKPGLFVFAIVELAIAYGFVSLAIDRGSLIWYILAIIFIVGFLQNIVKLIGVLFRHGTSKNA